MHRQPAYGPRKVITRIAVACVAVTVCGFSGKAPAAERATSPSRDREFVEATHFLLTGRDMQGMKQIMPNRYRDEADAESDGGVVSEYKFNPKKCFVESDGEDGYTEFYLGDLQKELSLVFDGSTYRIIMHGAKGKRPQCTIDAGDGARTCQDHIDVLFLRPVDINRYLATWSHLVNDFCPASKRK